MEIRMLFHPPKDPKFPRKPWIGYVNDVPFVGTSADMVDGFIALLQGDRKTAEAKSYKDFLDSAGIHDLKPGSILQNDTIQKVVGCSARVSKYIIDYIIQAKNPRAKATVKVTKAAQAGKDLTTSLSKSFKALRDTLKEHGIDLLEDVQQNRRSNRGEHVFNNALLRLYGSIIDLYIARHVEKGNRNTLVDSIPNSCVSDAFRSNAPDGRYLNLTADQRRNIRNWVVCIPDNMVYIPINNTLFSYMIGEIRNNAVKAMHSFSLFQNDEKVLRKLSQLVEWMNTHRVYLDPYAAGIWLFENQFRHHEFHMTEDGVQRMLRSIVPCKTTLLIEYVNMLILAANLVGVFIQGAVNHS
ncbi:uncharacterized protein LOC133108544 [Conger conger]|uniref:uncharacterized protein LOC133108544 n=1 Tax=Conger conger TaxID=82655 RepID=UPI002A59FFAF|nr:uncharacterized protein LOC133108544 [Conger conger]